MFGADPGNPAEWAAAIIAAVALLGTFVGFLIKGHRERKAARAKADQEQVDADRASRARANGVRAGLEGKIGMVRKGKDEFTFWIFNP
jgi:hypothetical protein